MEPNRNTHNAGNESKPNQQHSQPPDLSIHHKDAAEFAPDSHVTTDIQGLIQEANSTTGILLGHSGNYLIGKPLPLFAVAGARSRFYECLWRLSSVDASDAFETRMMRRKEDPRDVHIVARRQQQVVNGQKMAIVHWLIRDVTEWNRSESARRDLQRRLTTAQEDEQRRFARDLHDTASQTLTAILLNIRSIRELASQPEAALNQLRKVEQLGDELARQFHELATRLRPVALDDLGLEAAIRHLIFDWSERTKVPVDLQTIGITNQRFVPEIETVLYRVIQEALTNVAKLAGARHVAIMIGRSDGHVVAVIEDDGVGFDTEKTEEASRLGQSANDRPRLGLLGMRERAMLAGGKLEIESTPGQGTTIIARIPIEA